jgi:hypothetical protein
MRRQKVAYVALWTTRALPGWHEFSPDTTREEPVAKVDRQPHAILAQSRFRGGRQVHPGIALIDRAAVTGKQSKCVRVFFYVIEVA